MTGKARVTEVIGRSDTESLNKNINTSRMSYGLDSTNDAAIASLLMSCNGSD